MKLIIEVEFPSPMSPQREREVKRFISDLKDDLEGYGGTVVRADLVQK